MAVVLNGERPHEDRVVSLDWPTVDGLPSVRHRSQTYLSATNWRSIGRMWAIIVILLVLWAILSVVGFVFKGLLWLAVIGIILFFGTVVFGMIKSRAKKNQE